MRIKLLLGLIVVSSLASMAQNKFTPPNVKEGLWEVTMTASGSGMPGMPADALAKLPPDQRAQVEAMMKARGVTMNGNTTVVKSCVTKEKMERGMAFSEKRGNCTPTVVKSSASHMEIKLHCEETKDNGKQSTVDSSTTIDVVSQDSIKGSTHAVTNSDGHTMNMDYTFTSRYLGPACGDVK